MGEIITILILIILLVGCILYISALRKENRSLINDNEKQIHIIFKLENDLQFQKRLTKTFEAGYDNLKNKHNE